MENISVYIRLKPTKDKSDSNFSYDSKTITNSKTKENHQNLRQLI